MFNMLKKYIAVLTMASLIIPSTLLNLVNLDKAYAADNTVLINEMMVNSTQEWIELYNSSSDTPVDVSGWYFTSIDYAGSLYIIPTTTIIAPNGFLKLDLAGNKLRNDADDVSLLDTTSDTLDQITYGPNPWTQISSAPSVDKTIGRVDDGSSCWYSDLIASPNASNQASNSVLPVYTKSANIKATADNPANFINNITKATVAVEAELSSYQDSTLTAYLVDESGNKVNDTITAITDQTHQEFTLNANTLVDGTVVPWIKVIDTATGISTGYLEGTPGQKDIIAPDAPTAAYVNASTNNAANVINSYSKSAVTSSVTLGANSLTTDNVTLEFAGLLSYNSAGTNGAGTVNYASLDLQTLTDGNVALNAFVTDAAGNKSTTLTGTQANKDTVAPTSTITMADSTYGPLTWPDKVSGTASDATSGIDGIATSVQRNSDSKYFNGVDWQISEFLLTTTYTAGDWYFYLSSSILENGINYTVKSYAVDIASNTQVTSTTKSFTYDTSTPAGSFTINDGAVYTTSNTVTLKMTASADVTKMRFSNDNITWFGWENIAATKIWTLSAGDGNKTVYAQFKNAAGNESAKVSNIITFDTTAPAGTVSINNDATYTNNKSVTLTLAATDLTSGMDKMKFSNNGTSWSSWESYNTSKTWDLLATTYSTTNDGVKTVYAKFMDKAGNETTVTISDEITYDATAPVNGTLSIDSDAAYTTLGSVTLTLSASDVTSGMDKMLFSNDGTTWTTAEAYATSKTAWVLTSDDGVKTVYVKFVDKAGNQTLVISKTIIKDSILPTGTIAINNSANYTKSNNVTLNLSTTDTSGVKSMAFSNNGVDFTAWENYAVSKTYSLPTGDGTKTVYTKFMDKAGNISLIISDTIILDTVNPSDAVVVDTPNGGTVTKGDDVILSGTSEPNAQLTIRIYSDLAFTDYTNADSSGKWNYTVTSATLDKLTAGTHKITLAITDSAGNNSNEVQIAEFTLNDKVVTEVVAATSETQKIDQPVDTTPTGETEVETIGPENGDTKGEDTNSKTSRTLVTLAILIIAIGAVAGGYYGYQWWMEKDSSSKTKTTKKKTKKEEKFGRW
ncbi:MAG: hypothetical protein ACD_58C00245G0002 [uncultured bacterium]|nr:MAG: hypothetical protein ACD_58C00245G0002 [uncultured bacterium]